MNAARRSRSAMRRFGSRCFCILSMSLWMKRSQLLLQPTMQERDAPAPSATKGAKARAKRRDRKADTSRIGYITRRWRHGIIARARRDIPPVAEVEFLEHRAGGST